MATSKNSTFRINKRVIFETFVLLILPMLLSLERVNIEELLFSRLIVMLRFFYRNLSVFFGGRIVRYDRSKESRNLPKKIP